MTDIFREMAVSEAHRVLFLNDMESGLRAFIAIDDVTLGPACGGIRTRRYKSTMDALIDAQQLAHAMTLKCAIANLSAGGAKTVILDHSEMNRAESFQRLGSYIEELGGLYLCAGDLGTSPEDLNNVVMNTQYVNMTGEALGIATAETIANCMRACAAFRGHGGLTNLKVAIQGCGLIGSGLARKLAGEGVRLTVSDIDINKAENLAKEVNGLCIPPDKILLTDADIVSPCAMGAVITEDVAREMRAWAICGGANNQLKNESVLGALAKRDILYFPDFLASSGAVIDGVCRSISGQDAAPVLSAVYETAIKILKVAHSEKRHPTVIATEIAQSRIRTLRRNRQSKEFH